MNGLAFGKIARVSMSAQLDTLLFIALKDEDAFSLRVIIQLQSLRTNAFY